MKFCPKCGGRLVPRQISVEEEQPKYMKVWEYGKGWQSIEQEGEYSFMMKCRKCGYSRRAEVDEPEPVVKAKTAPLTDMPLASWRYPNNMSPDEYFRDEMRQANIVESITRSAPEKQAEKKSGSLNGWSDGNAAMN